MRVHAVHPGEDVEKERVAVQEAAAAIVVKLVRRHAQQVAQV